MTPGRLPDAYRKNASGLLLIPDRRTRYDQPVGIDLFAGAGGFSVGMHEAGMHMAAAVEYDVNAALTYLVNLARPGVRIHFDTEEREAAFTDTVERHLGLRKPGKGDAGSASAPRGQKGPVIQAGHLAGDGWISRQPASERGCEHFWIADVRNITGEQILGELGLRRGDVTVVCGGPPCQGYSVVGKRDVMDPRNSLVFEFARLVLEIWPKTFVMENVPGMLRMVTPEGVPVIDALCRIWADGGFSSYDALKASLNPEAKAGRRGAVRQEKNRDKPRRKTRQRPAPAPAPPADDGALFPVGEVLP